MPSGHDHHRHRQQDRELSSSYPLRPHPAGIESAGRGPLRGGAFQSADGRKVLQLTVARIMRFDPCYDPVEEGYIPADAAAYAATGHKAREKEREEQVQLLIGLLSHTAG